MDHILVPLDGSTLGEGVLPYVRQLARGTKAQVDLLRVVEPTEPPAKEAVGPPRGTAVKIAEAYVETVAKYFRAAGCPTTYRVAVGVPAAQILWATQHDPVTLTAMSTHGRSGVARWMLGSVTDKVLRTVASPLLVVRPTPRSPISPEPELKGVVVPLDGSSEGEAVLPHAMRLAKDLNLRVSIVRVTPSAIDYLRMASQGGASSPRVIVDFTETAKAVDADAMEYLQSMRTRLEREGVKSSIELAHGDPAQAIIDLVSDMDGGFVAMTTRGRTGAARAILGSVADRVVRHCGAPVLLVQSS